MLEIFRSEGVQYIFGIPGATEILFMDALEDCPDIKYVLGLHEVVVAGMAEGYARTSGIEGDIRVAVADLTSALIRRMSPEKLAEAQVRARIVGEEKQETDKRFAEKMLRDQEKVPISATRLMQEIRDTLNVGTRIVDDCWSCSAILRRTLQFSEAKSYQRARGGGSIGWGLPGAVGVKLASPDRPVVCISGDGSAMWSIQALWTAARYDIPVTYIICANACYQQVRNMKSLILGEKANG